jgi:release factor glutamine methyltransferase
MIAQRESMKFQTPRWPVAETTLPVREALRLASESLSQISNDAPSRQAEWMLEEILGIDRARLHSDRSLTLNPADVSRLRKFVERRAVHEPLQYILGTAEFRNLKLKVDRRALIPRPETEGIVDIGLEFLRDFPTPRILDIGTGCGALALAFLDEHPGASCTGVDISRDALDLAAENAEALGFSSRVRWQEGDVLSVDFAAQIGEKFDLIVSNPPYVSRDEADRLPAEVRLWEPATALFSKYGDLDTIETLARVSLSLLHPGSTLICEIGETQGSQVQQLFKQLGWEEHVRDDLNGKPRYLVAKKG